MSIKLKEYEIISKLGAGSFGVVYKANNKTKSQLCVIKQIQLTNLDARLKKWALNQASLMKSINSPYIVKYYNSFTQKNKFYIIMEFCPKGDLSKYIKLQLGKPIKQQIIWKFTIQIIVGLRDLHLKKVLHRDIKSLNIFLDENFNVRIGDLGVAKVVSTDFTSTIVGTPYYLSPEMCQQKPYNQKTDIWAMGCLIYELCTGKHPFQALNQAALALKIVMGKYQDIPSHYSKDLRTIIQSCLSVDHKRRPNTHYLLERPKIIEEAKKLNIDLSIIRKQTKNHIQNIKKQQEKTEAKFQLNKLTRPQESKKNTQNTSKLPTKSTVQINKVQKKHSVQKAIKKLSKSKQKINDIKKMQKKLLNSSKQKQKVKNYQSNNLPKKNNVPSLPNGSSKNPLLDKKPSVSISSSNFDKIKEKDKIVQKKQLKIQQKSVITQAMKNKQENKQSPKIQKNIKNKGAQISQSNFYKQRQKQNNNLIKQQYLENTSKRKQFNLEDKQKIKQSQKNVVKNLDKEYNNSNNNNKKIQNESHDSKMQQKMIKQTLFVKNKIQSQIDDDLLMAQFGITPQKVNNLTINITKQVKGKQINWQVQKQSNKKQKTQQFKQLPTIKSYSKNQQIKDVTFIQQTQTDSRIIKDQINQQNDQNRMNQDEEDNQPYKSDDQDNVNDQRNNNKGSIVQQFDQEQQDQDQRYLIQNIQAQVQQQALKEIQKSIQLYNKRLLQNNKRLIHLQSLKTHTEKQYFSHLSVQQYRKIKQKINESNNNPNKVNDKDFDKQIDQLIKELTKGKQNLLMKFLKIIGYQMEIELCEKNIKECKNKIVGLKGKIQKGDYLG